MKEKRSFITGFVLLFRKAEEIFLVFFLSLIIILTFSQIVLRTFFRSVEWFDLVVKYSVLWVAFIAANMAVFRNKHIKIDIIGRFAKGRVKSIILFLTNFFAAGVSLVLSYLSFIYVFTIEKTSTDPAPFLNIPKWYLLLILPFGFGMIGIRFLIRSISKINNYIKNKEDEVEEI